MADPCAAPGLLSVEEAHARLLAAAPPPSTTETVPLSAAHRRVLAADQRAPIDVPPADNAAMDGYALRFADLARAGDDGLPVTQRIPAGTVPRALAAGAAARIFTGAEIPPGADTVVMQEDCEATADRVRVRDVAAVRVRDHVRPRGQDIAAGSVLLAAGTWLGPSQIGVLASTGLAGVPVYPQLRVAFFSTGDELLEPGEALQPGRIYNSNRHALRAWLEAAGCVPRDLGVVPDRRDATVQALRDAATRADLVITTGGASVGEEDHLQAALAADGVVDLWKVAIKPGKPLLLGRLDAAGRQVPVLGLPGNPVSVAVTLLVLGLPLLRRMQGVQARTRPALRLPAGFAVAKPGKRHEYLRVRIAADAQGQPRLERFPDQGSGVLTSMAWADGLAVLAPGQVVRAGDLLEYLPFSALLEAT